MKFKRFTAILCSLLMLASLLAACGSNPGSEGSAPPENSTESVPSTDANQTATPDSDHPKGGEMVFAVSSMTKNLFAPVSGTTSVDAMFPASAPLGRRNPETREFECELAESVDFNEEDLTATIVLKKGIKYADGSDLNADSLKWMIDLYLENGNAVRIGNAVSCEKIDDYTVKITYKELTYNTPSSAYGLTPLSMQAYLDHGEEWCYTNYVTCGPYKLVDFVTDTSAVFERNEYYYSDKGQYLDRVTVNVIPDTTAQVAAFLNGEIDALFTTDPNVIEQVTQAGYDNPYTGSTIMNTVLANSKAEGDPLSNLKVRQAIFRYAIDADGITKAILGKYAEPWYQAAPKDGPGYVEGLDATYDPEKAKELLAEAGYPDGFETTIWCGATSKNLATALQANLADVGITANVEIVQSVNDNRANATPGLYIIGQISTLDNDNTCALGMWWGKTKGVWNTCLAHSDEYIAASDKWLTTLDVNERNEIAKELNQLFCVDDCLGRIIGGSVQYRFGNKHFPNFNYSLRRQGPPSVVDLWYEE